MQFGLNLGVVRRISGRKSHPGFHRVLTLLQPIDVIFSQSSRGNGLTVEIWAF
ncbi:hypothetical protein P775_13670 [Puniceibacterium antarcticum]|uniref:Uncharacterized protein n=1 Tax=Puniceibacterium antarcticum TaxID=1206336 RepID=A0A2G8RDE1_9RHOB|nr:hypothetical protein P775_13670 [Puniceibacterium antarcticum]